MKAVLLSGGLDSAVVLAHVRNTLDGPIHAISVDYGQRHRRELWSAFQLSRYYGATHRILTVPPEVLAGSTLTGDAGATAGAATVVPGRNLVLVGLAVAESVRVGAGRVGAGELYVGCHAGDAAVYPDCRCEFFGPLGTATLAAYGVTLIGPFINKTKAQIVARGRELLVPFDLTWSCYDPQGFDPLAPASGVACGKCGACVERAGALA
jgi:7-cyano-7-deazaguanine synthase